MSYRFIDPDFQENTCVYKQELICKKVKTQENEFTREHLRFIREDIMDIQLDDGLQFGLGVFETICLKNGKPVLLDWHLERIRHSMEALAIDQYITETEVLQWLQTELAQNREASAKTDPSPNRTASAKTDPFPDLSAMKLLITQKNKLMLLRSNPYTEERIREGFRLGISPIRRNETSPLVYHKTLNYGDNILEKRRTKDLSVDEVLFLNTRGELTEGSTTNLFLVKEGRLLTPSVSCGLLPGIMRRFVLEHFPCEEGILYPDDLIQAEECFVTNSLMGIMPVRRPGEPHPVPGPVTEQIMEQYRAQFI